MVEDREGASRGSVPHFRSWVAPSRSPIWLLLSTCAFVSNPVGPLALILLPKSRGELSDSSTTRGTLVADLAADTSIWYSTGGSYRFSAGSRSSTLSSKESAPR